MSRPSILCPIDFSSASRGALRYAIAIADRFGARLTLLAVNDPILTEAAELRMGAAWLASKGEPRAERIGRRSLRKSRLRLGFTPALLL